MQYINVTVKHNILWYNHSTVLLVVMLSEFGKDVGWDIFLYCSPREVGIVGELLQVAEGVHHFGREGERLVPVREKG